MSVVEHHSSLANPILDSAQGYSIQIHLGTAHSESDCAVPDSGSLDLLCFWDVALDKQIIHDFKKYKQKRRKAGSPVLPGDNGNCGGWSGYTHTLYSQNWIAQFKGYKRNLIP